MPKRDPIERPCKVCGEIMYLGGRYMPPLKTIYCSRRCLALGRRKLPKTKQLSNPDAAYISGVFDGEGSIILYDRGFGGRQQLRITISNTDKPLIDWLKATVGSGTIITKKWTKPEHAHYKTSYTWQIYGANAVSILQQMLPYLIVKRERAEYAIETQK